MHQYPEVPDQVEEGEEEGESELAYLQMNHTQYVVLTLVLYLGAVAGAIFA